MILDKRFCNSTCVKKLYGVAPEVTGCWQQLLEQRRGCLRLPLYYLVRSVTYSDENGREAAKRHGTAVLTSRSAPPSGAERLVEHHAAFVRQREESVVPNTRGISINVGKIREPQLTSHDCAIREPQPKSHDWMPSQTDTTKKVLRSIGTACTRDACLSRLSALFLSRSDTVIRSIRSLLPANG